MKQKLKRLATLGIAGALAWACLSTANAQTPNQDSDYVSIRQIWPVTQGYLQAAGERLRKPGKERITANGTVSRNGGPPTPVQVTWEVPLKIRVDEPGRAAIFDGRGAAPAIPADQQTSVTLETLLEDSLEGFFAAHQKGSNRFIGSGFGNRSAGPDVPVYDIIQVRTRSRIRMEQEPTVKRYWFNSRTKLLERVTYRLSTVPGSGLVEVLWKDWQEVQGEKIPLTVERKESGETTMLLRLSAAGLSPRAADGRFAGR